MIRGDGGPIVTAPRAANTHAVLIAHVGSRVIFTVFANPDNDPNVSSTAEAS